MSSKNSKNLISSVVRFVATTGFIPEVFSPSLGDANMKCGFCGQYLEDGVCRNHAFVLM